MKTKLLVCHRCGHDETEHEGNGGECQHVRYTEQRIESSDGVELRQDWTRCDCLYLLAHA